jgi:hypothetical protein
MPTPSPVCGHTMLEAVTDASWPSDPAALTVPPLDARAAASKSASPSTAIVSAAEPVVELRPSIRQRDHRQAGPQFKPPPLIALRI